MKPASLLHLLLAVAVFFQVLPVAHAWQSGSPFQELPSLPPSFQFQLAPVDTAAPNLTHQAAVQGKAVQGKAAVQSLADSIRIPNTHVSWSAFLDPKVASVDGGRTIVLSAELDQGYHIYKLDPGSQETQFRTLILAQSSDGVQFGRPTTISPVVTKDLGGGLVMEYYAGSLRWNIPIQLPVTDATEKYAVELWVGFNSCDDARCDPPAGIRFTGLISSDMLQMDSLSSSALQPEPIAFQSVANHPRLTDWFSTEIKQQDEFSENFIASSEPLRAWMIFAALLGGFILNFMPCVLPVVGLKLLSFVNQSGSDHRRVVVLNLAFVAGILVVVLCLAAFNIGTKLAGQAMGWGEQFNSFPLQITVVILLFAMSLSFLGVWEIPIPGFATSQHAGALMQREGPSGAFYKGILTTLLATPCSGPLLGAVFGETLKLSIVGSLVVFVCVGLGLGIPYLLMCVWPSVVRYLPKPGPWMETLKQLLAFPMLLSMVWFLNVMDSQYHIAMLMTIIGVWFACWLIGRVPLYAERHTRIRVWAVAATMAILTGFFSFNYFGPTRHHLPWEPYSESRLAELRAEGRPVMIEFTARWCPTCQTNMRLAIDRPQIAKVVDRMGMATLLADWSDNSSESNNSQAIRKKIQELDSNSIPLLAIYPAHQAEPIVLRDVITQQQLVDALEQADRTAAVSGTPKTADGRAGRIQ